MVIVTAVLPFARDHNAPPAARGKTAAIATHATTHCGWLSAVQIMGQAKTRPPRANANAAGKNLMG
jgi:hypothetical protein